MMVWASRRATGIFSSATLRQLWIIWPCRRESGRRSWPQPPASKGISSKLRSAPAPDLEWKGMSKQAEGLTAVFGALADSTRRGILARLASAGECTVTQLGEPHKMSAPAISKHLGVLEQAGLIQRWKSGRVHYCRLVPGPLDEARTWIEQHRMFWQQQFDALADYLE